MDIVEEVVFPLPMESVVAVVLFCLTACGLTSVLEKANNAIDEITHVVINK